MRHFIVALRFAWREGYQDGLEGCASGWTWGTPTTLLSRIYDYRRSQGEKKAAN